MAEINDNAPPEDDLPTPKSAWDVVFAAVITKTVTSPARFYFKDTDRKAAMDAFVTEMKADYGASDVKILRFVEVPIDAEWENQPEAPTLN